MVTDNFFRKEKKSWRRIKHLEKQKGVFKFKEEAKPPLFPLFFPLFSYKQEILRWSKMAYINLEQLLEQKPTKEGMKKRVFV